MGITAGRKTWIRRGTPTHNYIESLRRHGGDANILALLEAIKPGSDHVGLNGIALSELVTLKDIKQFIDEQISREAIQNSMHGRTPGTPDVKGWDDARHRVTRSLAAYIGSELRRGGSIDDRRLVRWEYALVRAAGIDQISYIRGVIGLKKFRPSAIPLRQPSSGL